MNDNPLMKTPGELIGDARRARGMSVDDLSLTTKIPVPMIEALERFPSNTIVRMVDSVKFLSTPELVDDAATFFAEHPIAQATKTLEQVLERQRVNTRFRLREAERQVEVWSAADS